MNKWLLFLFLAIVAFDTSFAQKSKWSVCYTPAVIEVPEISIGIQLGTVYDINKHFRIFSSLTTNTFRLEKSSKESSENHYLRLKSEIRYINLASNYWLKPYLGLQASFVSRSWKKNINGSYFEGSFNTNSTTYFSSASISSSTIALTTEFGINSQISKRLSLDCAFGIGGKLVSTKYSDVKDASSQLRFFPKCRIAPIPEPAYWVNGNVYRFQINPTLAILYRL
jgi:hypothetical protein